MIIKNLLLFILVFTLARCNNTCESSSELITHSSGLTSNVKFDKEGNLIVQRRISKDSIAVYFMKFNEKGGLRNLEIFFKGNSTREIFGFHENGKLRAKVNFTNGIKTGKAYYFYESGVIEVERNWNDNIKEEGIAVDYHDTTGNIKAVNLYNENGELYYRKSYNQKGELITVEGNESDVPDILMGCY